MVWWNLIRKMVLQQEPRKCETFGCPGVALRMVTLGPGTSVWWCEACLDREINERAAYDQKKTGR